MIENMSELNLRIKPKASLNNLKLNLNQDVKYIISDKVLDSVSNLDPDPSIFSNTDPDPVLDPSKKKHNFSKPSRH